MSARRRFRRRVERGDAVVIGLCKRHREDAGPLASKLLRAMQRWILEKELEAEGIPMQRGRINRELARRAPFCCHLGDDAVRAFMEALIAREIEAANPIVEEIVDAPA